MVSKRKALVHLRTADPVLAGLMDGVGPFRMEFREPTFDTLVRSIVFQQLSGRVARVIFGRLLEALGGSVSPEGVLSLDVPKMRAIGLSGQKSAYIQDLARHTTSGEIVFEQLKRLRDADVIAVLTQVKGVGVWTAQMFLMFALQRPDVLPVADLGIRSAIRKAYELEELPTAAEVERIGQPWRPYCTVACWYLWRSLDTEAAM